MRKNNLLLRGTLLLLVCWTVGGCSILQLPGQLIGGTFDILGKLIGFANKLPKPPPGVF